MFWFNTEDWDTALLNIAWTSYNLVMIAAVIAVAMETRQIRKGWRVEKELPAGLLLADGRQLDCNTLDYAMTGVRLKVDDTVQVNPGEMLTLSLFRDEKRFEFPAEVVAQDANGLRLRFNDLTLEQERNLVSATLSRPDAWLNWLKVRDEVDHPLHGFQELLGFSRMGVKSMKQAARKAA